VFGIMVLVMTYALAITNLSTTQIPSVCNGYQPLLRQCVPFLVIGSSNPPTSLCSTYKPHIYN